MSTNYTPNPDADSNVDANVDADANPDANPATEGRWWEGPEGHRFALEVLQLSLRRRMLSRIADGLCETDQIKAWLLSEHALSPKIAEHHLAMLERALVIERCECGWRVTETGRLYLDFVEARR